MNDGKTQHLKEHQCKQNNGEFLPRKPTGMADSHARTLSSKMPGTLTVVAQVIMKSAQQTDKK